jgi:hypothetical protein
LLLQKLIWTKAKCKIIVNILKYSLIFNDVDYYSQLSYNIVLLYYASFFFIMEGKEIVDKQIAKFRLTFNVFIDYFFQLHRNLYFTINGVYICKWFVHFFLISTNTYLTKRFAITLSAYQNLTSLKAISCDFSAYF